MYNGKRVIVSLTSWTKRIGTMHKTIESLINQVVKPDSIELNLSLEEFPNRVDSLPNEVVKFIGRNDIVNVNWIDGPNTRAFKKLIPALKKYKGEDYYILSADDDMIYRADWTSIMLRMIELFGVDYYALGPESFNIVGPSTVYRSVIFDSDYWERLTDEMIATSNDDVWTHVYFEYKRRTHKAYPFPDANEIITTHDDNNPLSDEYNSNDGMGKAFKIAYKIWN